MNDCDGCGVEIPDGAPCVRTYRFGSEADFLLGVNPTSRVVMCVACSGMKLGEPPAPPKPEPEPVP